MNILQVIFILITLGFFILSYQSFVSFKGGRVTYYIALEGVDFKGIKTFLLSQNSPFEFVEDLGRQELTSNTGLSLRSFGESIKVYMVNDQLYIESSLICKNQRIDFNKNKDNVDLIVRSLQVNRLVN